MQKQSRSNGKPIMQSPGSSSRNIHNTILEVFFFFFFLQLRASLVAPTVSDGKESSCNAGDLGSIPGLERSPGAGIATHSSILAWRIPMGKGDWWATVHRMARSVRHDRAPARLLCLWDSPGKNTRVGCRALLQGIF